MGDFIGARLPAESSRRKLSFSLKSIPRVLGQGVTDGIGDREGAVSLGNLNFPDLTAGILSDKARTNAKKSTRKDTQTRRSALETASRTGLRFAKCVEIVFQMKKPSHPNSTEDPEINVSNKTDRVDCAGDTWRRSTSFRAEGGVGSRGTG